MIYESTRKMTPNEQMAYDLGYNKAKAESAAQLAAVQAEKAATIARVAAERDAEKRRADAAISDMFGCMSTQGQCVRCKKRYYCDGTDDDKFSPLCKNNSHCYAWEWRGLHADNTDAPTGAGSEQNNESES